MAASSVTINPTPFLPDLPEGLVVIRYGRMKDPADRMLLMNGRILKALQPDSEGLVVQVAAGYKERYITADDRCVIMRDSGPRTLTARIEVESDVQEANIRNSLEEMGFKILG